MNGQVVEPNANRFTISQFRFGSQRWWSSIIYATFLEFVPPPREMDVDVKASRAVCFDDHFSKIQFHQSAGGRYSC